MQLRTQKLTRIILISLLFVSLAVFYFLWFRNPKTSFNAVPSQTAILLEYNSLSSFYTAGHTQDPTWQTLFESRVYETACADLDLILQCLGTTSIRADSGSVLNAFTLQEADSLHGLWIFSECVQPDLEAIFKQAEKLRWFPASFQGCKLYAVTMPGNAKMVFAQMAGLVFCSRYSYLVEDAISQFRSSKNWWADQKKMRAFAPGASCRMFVRPEALNTREGVFRAAWQHLPRWFQQHFKWLGAGLEHGKTIGYAEVDGFMPGNDTDNTQASAVFSVIPDAAAFVARVGIKPEARFGPQEANTEDADFQTYIQPWLGNEAAFVLTEPFAAGLSENQFILFSIKNQAEMIEKMQAYGKARGVLSSEAYQTFTITGFLSQSLLAPFCGQSEAFRNPVFAVVGPYAVFGGSRAAMEVWIDKYIVNQTIANQTDFLQLRSGLPETGNAFCYLNLDCLPALWAELTGSTASARLSHSGLLGIQAKAEGNQDLRLNLRVQPRGQQNETPGIFWKTPLNAPARTQPYICFGADSAVHVLIQDMRNELYCLSPAGSVEWRLPLDGPLLSGIRNFDFFANGTACFILNTPNKIWILNEKGEAVNRFPLPLQSPASNGLTLVDFDGNLKYSFFVACENKQVYGFDQYGRPLPGWNPQSGVGRVVSPIVHFQYMNMDFLAMLDVSGKLSVYGRNGRPHFPALQLQGSYNLPLQSDMTGRVPELLCFSREGTLTGIDPEGNLTVAHTDPLISGQLKAAVVGSSEESKGALCYLLVGKKLQVLKWGQGDLRTLNEHSTLNTLDTLFVLPNGSIGSLSRSGKRIYQVTGKGKTMLKEGESLEGSTPFTELPAAFSGGVRLLFTGNGPFLYAYKL